MVARDTSGHGNAGRLERKPSWTAAGKHGKALVFDGRNDSIATRDADALDLDAFTAMAWVKPRALGKHARPVIVKEAGTRHAYALYASGGDGHPLVKVGKPGGPGTVKLRCSSTVPKRAWTHIAATYDGTVLRIYVDGALCGERAWTGPVPASNGQLRIGGSRVSDEWFSGTIDAPQLFSRALAEGAIRERM
jgi:concanavalin A-like lectin/glucanase superfamily protein